VVEFIARLAIYKTNLDAVVAFFNTLPLCQEEIDSDLIPGGAEPALVLPNPHLVKLVLYSNYSSWRIFQMEERYPIFKGNPWFKASLILNTGVSNCPEHYYEAIGLLLENPKLLPCGSLHDDLGPFDFN
jgi:hypothetical protein